MSKRAAVLLALPLSLSGCERIDILDVDVRSDKQVTIHLRSARCIDRLEIITPRIKSQTLWEIERDPAQRSGCVREVTFPDTPAGFHTVVSASKLAKGSYAITGTAQNYAIAGNFDVPRRDPLL